MVNPVITHLEHLDQQTIEALEGLASTCQQEDGNKIAIYTDLLANQRPKPSSLLYYKEDQLIGFAAAFFFEHDTAEISLLVHPKYRKKGYGKRLLNTLLHSISASRAVSTLTFSTPHDLYNQTLIKRGLKYQGSEYDMQYQVTQPCALDLQDLSIRVATFMDMEILCLIDQTCFPSTHAYSVYRFETLLARNDNTIYVASYQNKVIGKAHLTWNKKMARLSDIAILPSMQNQGFGKKIIVYCINQALKIPQPNITLSVETHNKNALTLYQNIGFHITSALDYWSCSFFIL